MSGSPSISRPLRQQGVSLVVVLILLLIMTLLGSAVLRSTVLEERMSANLVDRNLSFQAAEAALREGEALAASRTNAEHAAIAAAAAGGACANGVCPRPDATAVERWKNTNFGGWRAATTSVGSIASAPQFLSNTWVHRRRGWNAISILATQAAISACALCIASPHEVKRQVEPA
ncbi:PilX N-terminal domain-containing pilus assembly protein [Xanthomonas citri pv. citri]